MIILFDTPNAANGGYSHLVADTIDNLHGFAQEIGLKRHNFENKRGKNRPHYDMRGDAIEKAKEHGAKLVTRKELLLFLKQNYG